MVSETNKQPIANMAEEALYGKVIEFILPSGYKVRIREQNGADDDIISNPITSQDLSNFRILISSLVLWTDLPFAVNNKISQESVKKMLSRDKWFIVFMSRINSMGSTVKFQYDWNQDGKEVFDFEDDLYDYVWDYSKPMPQEGDPEYRPYRFEPYDHDKAYKDIDITLSTGKALRWRYSDGESELIQMKAPAEQRTRNLGFKSRNLQQFMDNKWVKVENFQYFTKREIAELDKLISEQDMEFRGLTELEHPINKEKVLFPIISTHDFFYPREI
jgi:hypothetical protein